MTYKSAHEFIEKIKNENIEALRKDKTSIISQIVHGGFTKEEQISLRRELQKRLIEQIEKKDRTLVELQGTEEDIKRQCHITSAAAKKLVESDGKLSKIKRGQEKMNEEMNKAYILLQKRKRSESKEDILFLGVLGVFFAICLYVLVNRLLYR